MRLEVRWPAGVRLESLEAGRLAVFLDDTCAIVEPLAAHPDDPDAWVRAYLVRDVPTVWNVTILGRQEGVTDLGWPAVVLRTRITHGDRLIEQRLSVVYRMLEYFAAVSVRVPGDRMPAVEPLWLAALRTARPDWRVDDAICVHELLGGLT